MKDISSTVHLFKEGEVYVAYVPELDVSSCGDTPEEARKNIQEAAQAFLETSQEMGNLTRSLKRLVTSWKERPGARLNSYPLTT